MFKELGLDTDGETTYPNRLSDKEFAEITGLTSASTDPTSEYTSERGEGSSEGRRVQETQGPREDNNQNTSPRSATATNNKWWFSKLVTGRRPRVKTASSAPPPTMSSLTRLTSVALLVAVVIPGFSYYNGREKVTPNGADAGVINRNPRGPVLETRAGSPEVCKRWSHQGRYLRPDYNSWSKMANARQLLHSTEHSTSTEAKPRHQGTRRQIPGVCTSSVDM